MSKPTKLNEFRTAIRDYLLALAATNEAENNYWKQQISATFIAYPERTVEEIEENFKAENHANPVLATCNSLFKVFNNLPVEEKDNVATLERILKRPGSVIPENPQGHTDKIVIGGRNVTHLTTQLVRISMLRYLYEHFDQIRNHLLIDKTWLDLQVNNIKETAKNPHQYCQRHQVFDFDDLERAFNDMNVAVDRTIIQNKQLDTQTRREIRKKDTEKRNKQKKERAKAKRREKIEARRQEAKPAARREAVNQAVRRDEALAAEAPIAMPRAAPQVKSNSKIKALGYMGSAVTSYFAIVGGLIPSLLAYNLFFQLAAAAVLPLMVFVGFKIMVAGLKAVNSFLFGAPQAPLQRMERADIIHENNENGYVIERRAYSPQRALNRGRADERLDERQDRSRRFKRF